VGRLIGRSGVTIKGLQLLTGTVIEIDQRPDPSQVIVLGASAQATRFALSIIDDIVGGNFKGFALLRDVVAASRKGIDLSGSFVYAPGIGLLPRRQVSGDTNERGRNPVVLS
jgi:rRNA processing protein Krr1/Pno1